MAGRFRMQVLLSVTAAWSTRLIQPIRGIRPTPLMAMATRLITAAVMSVTAAVGSAEAGLTAVSSRQLTARMRLHRAAGDTGVAPVSCPGLARLRRPSGAGLSRGN